MRAMVAIVALAALIVILTLAPGSSLPKTTLRARNLLEAILWLLGAAIARHAPVGTNPQGLAASAVAAAPAPAHEQPAVLLC